MKWSVSWPVVLSIIGFPVQSVQLKLPVPQNFKGCSPQLERTLVLRDTKESREVSSVCPYSKEAFDQLFDEAATERIVVAGVVTDVEGKLVAHYFDALALMQYFVQLLPRNRLLSEFSYQDYYHLKNGFKNVIDPHDRGLYTFPMAWRMTEREREWYAPIFVDPINRQNVVMLDFFTIARSSKENGGYAYRASYMGSLEHAVATKKTSANFYSQIVGNTHWREKLEMYADEIESITLRYINEPPNDIDKALLDRIDDRYNDLRSIMVQRKDDIKDDKELKNLKKNKLTPLVGIIADFL